MRSINILLIFVLLTAGVSVGSSANVIRRLTAKTPPDCVADCEFCPEKYTCSVALETSKCGTIDEAMTNYLQMAEVSQRQLISLMSDLKGSTGVTFNPGVKTKESAMRKLTVQKCKFRKMTDLSRGAVGFKTLKEVQSLTKDDGAKIKEMAKKHNLEVLMVKSTFEKPWDDGYRDVQLKLKGDNGIIIELQIHLCAIKNWTEGGGHKIYEQVRDIRGLAIAEKRDQSDDEREQILKLNEESKKSYDQAQSREEECSRVTHLF